MDFSVLIINLVKALKELRESIISNQIGRSGTSIGANIREALRRMMKGKNLKTPLSERILSLPTI